MPFTRKEMEARGEYFQVVELKPDRNEKKASRILSMQPYFRSGQIYILSGMMDFIDEYESFPNGRTKDILDAMAYAVRLLVPVVQATKPSLIRELEQLDPSSKRYWKALAVKRGDAEPDATIDDVLDGDEETNVEGGIGELVCG